MEATAQTSTTAGAPHGIHIAVVTIFTTNSRPTLRRVTPWSVPSCSSTITIITSSSNLMPAISSKAMAMQPTRTPLPMLTRCTAITTTRVGRAMRATTILTSSLGQRVRLPQRGHRLITYRIITTSFSNCAWLSVAIEYSLIRLWAIMYVYNV